MIIKTVDVDALVTIYPKRVFSKDNTEQHQIVKYILKC